MNPTAGESRRSVLFFLLTLGSVTLFSLEGVAWGAPLSNSLAFAGALMGILLAHEMGHYVVARIHGFRLSLPLFLPLPSGFGTLGAIIRLRSAPPSRQALLEMGIAGPLCGAVVAFAILALTLPLPAEPWQGEPGWLARLLGAGAPAAEDGPYVVTIFNDPLIVRLLGTLVLGAPPDRYAVLHPATLAGWVGCMLTGINLLPIGQLDGGHVMNAVVPALARRVSIVLAVGLLAAGLVWAGWFVWGALLLLLGAARPLPVPADPPLPLRSRLLAALAVVVFVLTFMPVPLEVEEWPRRVDGSPLPGTGEAADAQPPR